MKFYTLSLFIVLLSVSSSLSSYAQKCLTSDIRKEKIANNPAIAEKMEDLNYFTREWIALNESRPREVITLPIVVHVLWFEEEENISDEQIMSQIQVLNDDFRKNNSNFSSTAVEFQNIAADVEIEFCLATVDPSGNPTSGITRNETFIEGIGDTEFYYSYDDGGVDSWDVNSYINIWVCSLGSDDFLGYAFTPGTADPIEADGIVIDYRYFGTTGTASNSFPNHLGRTSTHEMGHYLNLEHLWGPDEGGCEEDDFVNDTPTQDWESEGCPSYPFFDDCSFSGKGINFNNYLDYTADVCMTMFTEGQKMRMLAALNGPRSSLLSSNACSPPVSTDDQKPINYILVSPNPASDFINIKSNRNNFQIFSHTGHYIKSFETYNLESRLDISSLPSGIYIIRNEQEPELSTKLLISH